MNTRMTQLIVVGCCLAGSLGCGEVDGRSGWTSSVFSEPASLKCPDDGGEGEIILSVNAPTESVNQDVTITGTALHTRHLAIENVSVGGVPATSTEGNFAKWSAVLPLSELRGARDGDSREVRIKATARDVCGKEVGSSTALLEIDGSVVGTLDRIELTPSEATLPVSSRLGTTMTVTTNPEAAGLSARFGCDGCSFLRPGAQEAKSSSIDRTLTVNDSDATASVYVVSETAGTAVVIVEVGDQFKSAVLTVEDPSE